MDYELLMDDSLGPNPSRIDKVRDVITEIVNYLISISHVPALCCKKKCTGDVLFFSINPHEHRFS